MDGWRGRWLGEGKGCQEISSNRIWETSGGGPAYKSGGNDVRKGERRGRRQANGRVNREEEREPPLSTVNTASRVTALTAVVPLLPLGTSWKKGKGRGGEPQERLWEGEGKPSDEPEELHQESSVCVCVQPLPPYFCLSCALSPLYPLF